MLIFLPLSPEELQTLVTDGLTHVDAHAATPALLDGLGLGPGMDEDAEFAALTYASVACLTRTRQRCVAVADVAGGIEDRCDDFGRVRVARVEPSALRSVFIDEAEVSALVAVAHQAADGRPLEVAWETDPVQALLVQADLLWHDAEEVPLVLSMLGAG